MVMAIDTLTRLCPGVLFDWRLYAERGAPRYFHIHTDGRRTDDCELNFIKKVGYVTVAQSHTLACLKCVEQIACVVQFQFVEMFNVWSFVSAQVESSLVEKQC